MVFVHYRGLALMALTFTFLLDQLGATLRQGQATFLEQHVPIKQRPPLLMEVLSNIGKPGIVLYNLETQNTVNLNYTLQCFSLDTVYTVVATTSVQSVALVIINHTFNISCADSLPVSEDTGASSPFQDVTKNGSQAQSPNYIGQVRGQVNMTIQAHMIGRSFLMLTTDQANNSDLPEIDADLTQGIISGQSRNVQTGNNNSLGSPNVFPSNVVGQAIVIVMQLPRTIDNIFRILLYIVISMATAGMGVKVDLTIIRTVMRRPAAPLIGLACQYICMPVIAYMVAKLVPQDSAAVSLGIFACGVVPGGGPSNMFSYLLGGDLSLSVTMTTLSNVASLGLLPLWIFTLGSTFKDDTVSLTVPYEKILEALAMVILPLFLGIFIQYKLPRVAKIISKILSPFLIIIVAFLITFGIYTNFFIFRMIKPMTIFAGCLLPYVGYFIGGLVSFLCCQSWTRVKTIAIETGIQNTGIAFLLLFLSLPPPDNQLAAVGPASSAIMTPLPLFVAVLMYTVYKRCLGHTTQEGSKNEEAEEQEDLENGNIPKKDKKVAVKNVVRRDERAAIIVVWRILTKTNKEDLTAAEKMLNKELEVTNLERETNI